MVVVLVGDLGALLADGVADRDPDDAGHHDAEDDEDRVLDGGRALVPAADVAPAVQPHRDGEAGDADHGSSGGWGHPPMRVIAGYPTRTSSTSRSRLVGTYSRVVAVAARFCSAVRSATRSDWARLSSVW